MFLENCKNNFQIHTALQDCEWNTWRTGGCSHSCGGGNRTNTRTKKVLESFVGTCEGKETLIEACNPQDCPSK